MEMILITKGLAESNKHKKNGLNLFGFNNTKEDKYFCDKNSLITHPEIFVGQSPITFIEVTPEDLVEPVID